MNIIFDSKARRRKFLMRQEIKKDCLRYEDECHDLGTHKITQEELEQFNTKLHRDAHKYDFLQSYKEGWKHDSSIYN